MAHVTAVGLDAVFAATMKDAQAGGATWTDAAMKAVDAVEAAGASAAAEASTAKAVEVKRRWNVAKEKVDLWTPTSDFHSFPNCSMADRDGTLLMMFAELCKFPMCALQRNGLVVRRSWYD